MSNRTIKVSNPRTLGEETVTCENCRYHYRFLYDRSPGLGRLDAVKEHTSKLTQKVAKAKLEFTDWREAFQPCPVCGSYQDWMVKLERSRIFREVSIKMGWGLGFGLGALLTALGASMVGYAWMIDLADILGITFGIGCLVTSVVLSGYWYYLQVVWNPNLNAEHRSFDAAVVKSG